MGEPMQFTVNCPACDATGLYVGMAERDGYAVQCSRCKGSGHVEQTVTRFEGRKERTGVRMVLQANPGICVGGNHDFGGISFDSWQRGLGFTQGTEMREFTCPAWWYQSADYRRKPEWEECFDTLGSRFSDCPHFCQKEKCWERFDRGQEVTQ